MKSPDTLINLIPLNNMKKAIVLISFLLVAGAAIGQKINKGFYGTWRTDGTSQVITIAQGEKGGFTVSAVADGEAFEVTNVSGKGKTITATFTYVPNSWTTTSTFTLGKKGQMHEVYSGAMSGEFDWKKD